MMNFIARSIYLVALTGVLFFDNPVAPYAQAASAAAPAATKVSDQELQSFARMYVAYQRIRNSYEGRIGKAADAKEKETLRQEGDAEVKEALAKHGLTAQAYNRLFNVVNGDAQLRQKALKLIEAERRQS